MSVDGRDGPAPAAGNGGLGNSNNSAAAFVTMSSQRLRLNPNKEHKPESYEDMQLDFSPSIFSSLERYLPPNMLGVPRYDKVKFMREILLKYLPHGERNRVQKHRDYRQKIILNYQPLHKELYLLDPATTFVPAFLEAVNENTEESFKRICSEPSPGIYTFEIFQPRFCELLLAEVENFEKWVGDSKYRIMRPNTMNRYGAVLDDFGLETMLDKLLEGFVRPIAKELFPEVGGSTLDSHHGFVVEYGNNRDLDLGFHVDDSEVTLNVCLGKQFSGGELYFRGIRCDKHVNSGSRPEAFVAASSHHVVVLKSGNRIAKKISFFKKEVFDYSHTPGYAVLHRGRHRHGAKATTSGHRVNLLLWCRSSVFREMRKYQKDFSNWCGECLHEKKERQRMSITATKQELLLRKDDESTA